MQLTNKFLTTKCEEIDYYNPPFDIEQVSLDMIRIMKESNGLGLSANQVGLPYRMFVVDSDPIYVMINPRIVTTSNDLIQLEEGCLSFPGLIVPIKRPSMIKIRFMAPDGKTYTRDFAGLMARVCQHEISHLNGELFYNSANRYHRDKALRKWKKNIS